MTARGVHERNAVIVPKAKVDRLLPRQIFCFEELSTGYRHTLLREAHMSSLLIFRFHNSQTA